MRQPYTGATGEAARAVNASIWAAEGRDEVGIGGGPSSERGRLGIRGRPVGIGGSWESSSCDGFCLDENPIITGVFVFVLTFVGVLGGSFLGWAISWGSGVAFACGLAGREGSLGGRLGRGGSAGSALLGGRSEGIDRLVFTALAAAAASSRSLRVGGSLGRLAGS